MTGMSQGSHVTNFEALSVPKSKWQAITYIHTDVTQFLTKNNQTQTSHKISYYLLLGGHRLKSVVGWRKRKFIR